MVDASTLERGRVAASRAAVDQRDLVERAGRGDHDAFGALVGATIAELEAVARLILRDHELARDAVQDAYIKAWRDLPGLREPERFEAWLHRLLVNTCLDTLRKRRRRPMEVELMPITPPSIGDETGWVADRDQLERGFRGLDPDQRAVLVLHYYVGMSVPMVAETLGVPLGTAQSRLGRALAASGRRSGLSSKPSTSPSSGEGSHERHRSPRARAHYVVRRHGGPADARLDRGHPCGDGDHPPAAALVVPGTLAARGRRPAAAAADPAPVPWRTIALLALLGLLLAAAVTLYVGSRPRLPAPFGPAANGLVAYAENGEIWTVDPVTGDRNKIVTLTGANRAPRLSRDGTHVAFLRRLRRGTARDHARGRHAPGRVEGSAACRSRHRFDRLVTGRSLVAVVADSGLGRTTYLVDSTTGEVRDLNTPGVDVEAYWRPPDGRQLM